MATRTIAIASGKGGTGKTSLAINLGIILSQMGKSTVVVDADIAMANVGIMLGVDRTPINLHNVLMGETSVKDAIYEGPAKLKYVPCGLSLEKIKKVDYDKLPGAIAQLEKMFDFVLLDCAPGIEKDSQAALKSSKELLLVLNPEPAALADALKLKTTADKYGVNTIGAVVNMSTGEKTEVKPKEIEALLGTKVITVIPLDTNAKKASNMQKPVVAAYPTSEYAHAVAELAAVLTGAPIKQRATVKKGLITSIVESLTSAFKKKS